MKCVGHFGSVRAGGTQSNCSLEGKCDRASLSPLHQTGSTSSPKQGESRRGGGERQMVAANKSGGKAGAGGRLEGE